MHTKKWGIAASALLLVGSHHVRATEQCVLPEYAEITASDPTYFARYGRSVALSGDLAAIGAPYHEFNGGQSGSAYVLRRDGFEWEEIAELNPDNPTPGDEFGASVAIDGDVIVVGAWRDSGPGPRFGAAYVFERVNGAWSQVATLSASDGEILAAFGACVAIRGDTIVVTAQNDGMTLGAAYIFRRVDGVWTETAVLRADDPASARGFGISAAFDGTTLVVGAPSATPVVSVPTGAAYIFHEVNGVWTQTARLLADDASSNDRFGESVAISGPDIIVGAIAAPTPTGDRGAAYIFQSGSGQWTQVRKLVPPAGSYAVRFGINVAADNGVFAIASERDHWGRYIASGSVFVLEAEEAWMNDVILTAPDAADLDQFGSSVAIAEGVVIVGADGSNRTVNWEGSVHAFDLFTGSTDCNANGRPDECDIQIGVSQDCNANGLPDECDIASQVGADCDGDGLLDECVIPTLLEYDTLAPDDLALNQRFGRSVDLSGDLAAGSVHDADVAYVFENGDGVWTQSAELTPAPAFPEAEFGGAVVIDGESVIVSAHGDNETHEDSGAVYVFDKLDGVWSQSAKLKAEDADAFDNFGFAVAVSGATMLIGAPGDDEAGDDAGAVYVFRKIGGVWSQTAKLLADATAGVDRFGVTVAIDGSIAAIAADIVNSTTGTGAVFVFRESNGAWTQDVQLPSPPAQGSVLRFGRFLGISGNTIASYMEIFPVTGGPTTSYVVLYEEAGGIWIKAPFDIRYPSFNAFGDRSGFDFSADALIVGLTRDLGAAPGADTFPAEVYRKVNGQWSQVAMLSTSDGSTSNGFGGAIAIDGARVLTAAAWTPVGDSLGAAYFHDLSIVRTPGDLNGNSYVDFDDATILVDVLLDFDSDPNHAARADVNCSGEVDGRDLRFFIDALLGGA